MYENSSSAGGAGLLFALLIPLVILSVVMWVYSRVARQAGYSGWWALAIVVPVLNIVMLCIFAFSTWPVQRRVQMLEHQLRSQHDAWVRERVGVPSGTVPGGATYATYIGSPDGSPRRAAPRSSALPRPVLPPTPDQAPTTF